MPPATAGIFTQSEQEWQLILYNYTHYDNIYRYRYRRLEHPEDAYSLFESGKVVRFQITFPALGRGLYRIEQQEITRTSGSSFDLWLAAGAPPSPDRAFLQYLAEHASAHRTLTTEQVDTAPAARDQRCATRLKSGSSASER